jgi:hypothetical protein
MLSADLGHVAAAVRHAAYRPALSPDFLLTVSLVLDDCADQAASLEACVAPGSPLPDNVVPMMPVVSERAKA